MITSKFHPHFTREKAIEKLDDSVTRGVLTSEERNAIIKCLDDRAAMVSRFGEARWYKISSILRSFRENKYLRVPWTEITMDEFVSALGRMKNQDYKPATLQDYVIISKMFYRWMMENGLCEQNERNLNKIKIPRVPDPKIDMKKIFSKEQIALLISEGGNSIKLKCMFSLWYELALRPNEVAGLNWDDITFEEEGVWVNIRTTKTDYNRLIWLVVYREYLIAWRNTYPGDPSGNRPVFVDMKGNRYKFGALESIFHDRCEAIGLPYIPTGYMRKTRGMHMVLEGLPEYVVKSIMWGNINTAVYKYYVNPTASNVRDALMEHMGVIQKTPAQKVLGPITCPKCLYINSPDSDFCKHCGLPLNKQDAQLIEEVKRRMDLIDLPAEDKTLDGLSDEDLMRELQNRMVNKKHA